MIMQPELFDISSEIITRKATGNIHIYALFYADRQETQINFC